MFRHQVEAGVLLENRCRYPQANTEQKLEGSTMPCGILTVRGNDCRPGLRGSQPLAEPNAGKPHPAKHAQGRGSLERYYNEGGGPPARDHQSKVSLPMHVRFAARFFSPPQREFRSVFRYPLHSIPEHLGTVD